MNQVATRAATEGDIAAMNAIYNRYIVDSHVSFDTEPWTLEDRRSWYRERLQAGYPILVATVDGDVVGASWSGPWRDKAAYRSTVETTIVLDPQAVGSGIGTVLYRALLDELSRLGFVVAIGIVALPNDASIALHTKLGFREVGVLDDVGFKDGVRRSTMLLQRGLSGP